MKYTIVRHALIVIYIGSLNAGPTECTHIAYSHAAPPYIRSKGSSI